MKEPGLIADTLQQSQISQSKTRPADVGIVSESDKRTSSFVRLCYANRLAGLSLGER